MTPIDTKCHDKGTKKENYASSPASYKEKTKREKKPMDLIHKEKKKCKKGLMDVRDKPRSSKRPVDVRDFVRDVHKMRTATKHIDMRDL